MPGRAFRVVAEPSFYIRTPNLRVTNQATDFRVAVNWAGKNRAHVETDAYVFRGATMLTYENASRASFYNTDTAAEMAKRQVRKGTPTCYAGQQTKVGGGTGVGRGPRLNVDGLRGSERRANDEWSVVNHLTREVAERFGFRRPS